MRVVLAAIVLALTGLIVPGISNAQSSVAVTGTDCDHRARMVKTANIEWPDPGFNVGAKTVRVTVDIGADGTLNDAEILTSSGYELFDSAALSAVKDSTFAPRVANCQAVASSEVFRADFNPGKRFSQTLDPMRTPHLAIDGQWPVTTAEDLYLQFAGQVFGVWQHGDDKVAIAEYVTIVPDLTVQDAFASVESGLELFAPMLAQKATSEMLCNGTLPAQETRFTFNSDDGDVFDADVTVTVSHGNVYTIAHTVPHGSSFDPSVASAISRFCV